MSSPRLTLWLEGGESSLDVRQFEVREAISAPFEVRVRAVSPDHDVDFEAIAGKRASFTIESGIVHGAAQGRRVWRGVCRSIEMARSGEEGLAAYDLTIVPALGLLALRRDQRLFQDKNVPDIVKEVLEPFHVDAKWEIDPGAHPKLEVRVQHGEADLAFAMRLVEEAGIAFFAGGADDDPEVLFTDAPHSAEALSPALRFSDSPNRAGDEPFVTKAELVRDARKPSAAGAWEWTPRDAAAPREGEPVLAFETSVVEVGPGAVVSIADHPADAVSGPRWLVVERAASGAVTGEWQFRCLAVRADKAFRPPRRTPKPRAVGLQTAVVTGPTGEEIHTDELGRVRVRFRWDRGEAPDATASPWLRVSHPAAGSGYGTASLPRVGQEVLVAFFEGDPDRPVVVGGAYNAAATPPLPLPQRAGATVWRSRTTPQSSDFNDLVLDDAAGNEVLGVRAERDMALYVHRNEVSTVAGKRGKLVKGDEAETTGQARTGITGPRKSLVDKDVSVRVDGARSRRVVLDRDAMIGGVAHVLVEVDDHAISHKEERIAIKGKASYQVDGDDHAVAFGRMALEATSEIHLKTQAEGIFGGVKSVTLVAGSSYVLIDSSGVTIQGTMVKINSGGEAGQGSGASPDDPESPEDVADFDPPTPYDAPTPDGEEAPPVAPPEPVIEPVKEVELSWIEIHLVDADGEPVGGERFRVKTPDGKVREGHLNSDGRARLEGIVPGSCEISFPDLDARDLA